MRHRPILIACVTGLFACEAAPGRVPTSSPATGDAAADSDSVTVLPVDAAAPDASSELAPDDTNSADAGPEPEDVARPPEDASLAPDDTALPDSIAPSPDTGPTIDPECADLQPGEAVARLLTRLEYDLAAGDLLFTTTTIARDTFPPENHALGFENNADAHLPSPALVEAQMEAARVLADDTVTHRLAQVAPCAVQGGDAAACRDAVTAELGRRAFRRPLAPIEHALLKLAWDAGATTSGLAGGVALTIRTALLSPQFLYRVTEVLAGDVEGAAIPLTGYELAERLSFFLWSSMPDDELLAAAASGLLDTADGLESEARRLLTHPRALDTIDSFHRQWLELDKLAHIEKTLPEGLTSAGITIEALRESWRESMEAFVHSAVLPPGDGLAGLLGSSTVYVDDVLAVVHAGAPSSAEDYLPWAAPEAERAGLLTQPAILAILANGSQSSPIRRGLFVRDRLLCQPIPPPPADVVITPPDPDPNATTRERFAEHTANEKCAGCHTLIDPIGFGFEHYDHLGRWRDTENGLPIDATGALTWVQGDPAAEGPFDGAIELADRLAASPRVASCVAEHWYRFAMGRGTSAPADGCNLTQVSGAFVAAGGDVTELLVAIVRSDAFRFRPGTPWVPPEPVDESDPALVIPTPVPTEELPPIEVPPGDPIPTSPIGFWDSVQDNGLVSGWALDPNQPSYELFIVVRVDGQTVEPYPRADLPRPDVNQVTGYVGDHGFRFVLPSSALDGKAHTLELIAVDVGDSPNVQLVGSPKTFQVSSALPRGFVDVVSGATAAGWAYDPDSPTTSLTVRLYLDAPSWAGGTLLGETTTTGARPDVIAAFSLPAESLPGWSFTMPAWALDGKAHTVYAEGIDSGTGTSAFIEPTGGKAWTGGTP
ncbi:MAG: DUF1588 domain-containing protein [Myxococcales bacterium]|nr:DUF1588 domain-containing protein [Myxococcales bacterium]